MYKSKRAWFEVATRPEKKSRWRRKGGGGGPRAVLLGCTQCTVVMMGSDKTRITRLYPACLYCLNTSWLTTNTTCRLFCSALSSIVLGGLYSESVSCSIVVQRFWVKARVGTLKFRGDRHQQLNVWLIGAFYTLLYCTTVSDKAWEVKEKHCGCSKAWHSRAKDCQQQPNVLVKPPLALSTSIYLVTLVILLLAAQGNSAVKSREFLWKESACPRIRRGDGGLPAVWLKLWVVYNLWFGHHEEAGHSGRSNPSQLSRLLSARLGQPSLFKAPHPFSNQTILAFASVCSFFPLLKISVIQK